MTNLSLRNLFLLNSVFDFLTAIGIFIFRDLIAKTFFLKEWGYFTVFIFIILLMTFSFLAFYATKNKKIGNAFLNLKIFFLTAIIFSLIYFILQFGWSLLSSIFLGISFMKFLILLEYSSKTNNITDFGS